jgi:hypothetical protein
MGRFRTVIDAIAADLETSLTLPDHKLQKYAFPLSLTPERCPMLAVYTVRYPRRLIATPGTYEQDLELEVAWYESGAAYGETAGATDNDLPGRMLDTIELIGDHLETYAVAIPGVPQVGANLPDYATIGMGETSPNQSMVWRAMYELTVTGTALRSIP